MHILDVLKYGHKTVLDTITDLTPEEWGTVGATSQWTPKDVMAHLASYEQAHADLLDTFLGMPVTPLLTSFQNEYESFGDREVDKRKTTTLENILSEYTSAYQRISVAAPKLQKEQWEKAGTIPWYGDAYSLDDFMVYNSYSHKREHTAMIRQLLKRLRP